MSIEVQWEHREAGEDVDASADAFDLDAADLHWALAHETSVRVA